MLEHDVLFSLSARDQTNVTMKARGHREVADSRFELGELLRYREPARAVAELEMGELAPLVEALPELAEASGWTKGWAKSGPGSSGAQSGNGESRNDIDVVHEAGLDPAHLAVPEPKAHRKVQEAACTRNLKHEAAGRSTNVHEGPPRSVGVGHDESVREARRDGVVKSREGGVRVATAEGLARAVVDALADGDMEGAVAAVDALRAFVVALGRLPNRLSDCSIRASYEGRLAPVTPIRFAGEKLAA